MEFGYKKSSGQNWDGYEVSSTNRDLAELAVGFVGQAALGTLGKVLKKAPASTWDSAPIVRGNQIEKLLGANLPRTFPVVDKLENGVATSIKSADLRAATYQNGSRLEARMRSYVDKLIDFQQGAREGVRLKHGDNFVGKALEVAIPHAPNAAQQKAIGRVLDYGNLNGVDVFMKIVE